LLINATFVKEAMISQTITDVNASVLDQK